MPTGLALGTGFRTAGALANIGQKAAPYAAGVGSGALQTLGRQEDQFDTTFEEGLELGTSAVLGGLIPGIGPVASRTLTGLLDAAPGGAARAIRNMPGMRAKERKASAPTRDVSPRQLRANERLNREKMLGIDDIEDFYDPSEPYPLLTENPRIDWNVLKDSSTGTIGRLAKDKDVDLTDITKKVRPTPQENKETLDFLKSQISRKSKKKRGKPEYTIDPTGQVRVTRSEYTPDQIEGFREDLDGRTIKAIQNLLENTQSKRSVLSQLFGSTAVGTLNDYYDPLDTSP